MDTPTSHPNSEIVEADVKIGQPSLNLSQNPDRLSLSLEEKLDAWCPVQVLPTIYKVYDELRSIRSDAYEPTTIAIGPYHSDKENLKKMEIHKLAYLRSFLDRQNKSIRDYVSAIERLEPEARKCYADPIALNSIKFTEILVLDGCFILEFALLLSNPSLRNQNDCIFIWAWMITNIARDLLLLENQIPFSILSALSDSSEDLVPNLLKIFAVEFPGLQLNLFPIESPLYIKHLLELVHFSLVHSLPAEEHCEDRDPEFDFIHTATSLAEYDVTFKGANKSASMFQIAFENGCLRIPRLRVTDSSESYFRNLIAYESYFPRKVNHVCNYVTFMDSLINTPEDVKLLTKCQIIDNWLASEKNVADMFNGLAKHITISTKFFYVRQFKRVNEHCSRPWNRYMAKLKQNHFNSPWAIISIIAAFVLLVLTFVQTVFAVIK